MAIVNYENLPSENTPLTGGATGNLNVMQENGTSHGTDTKLGYAQSFLNEHIINVSTEVDEDYKVNMVYSQNLLIPTLTSSTPSGLTITKNDDNTYKINGTSSQAYSIVWAENIKLKKGHYYITLFKKFAVNLFYTKDDGTNVIITSSLMNNDYFEFDIPEDMNLKYIKSYIANSGVQFSNDIFKPMISTSIPLEYTMCIPSKIQVNNDTYTETIGIGTSLDSRSRVNVLYSKNLFDKDNANTLNGYFFATSPTTITSDSGNRVLYIPCKPNTTYTIQKTPQTNTRQLGYTKTTPAIGTQVYGIVEFTGTTGTITTGADAQYLVCRYYQSAQDTAYTETQIKASIIIQEGSSITTPSIYVDGEMLVSKNVYSTGEVVIGEWFGKPLYRKVIEINNPTLDAWATINHNISNMDFGRIEDATITRTIYGATSYIPIGVSNISAGTLFTCDLQKTIFEYKIAGYTNITNLTAVVEYTKTTD